MSPSSSADDITVSLPPLEEVTRDWLIIEPILKRATDRVRGYEPIDILRLVMLGRMALFVIRDAGQIVAVCATEVHEYPRCRALDAAFVAGTGMRRWHRQLNAALDAQAEALGCVDVVGHDRKGWARFGFEIVGVVLMRRLKE